jgi:uncharacterized protein (TIGR02284 family)
MMTNEKIIEELNELIQYDIDALGGYNEAISKIDVAGIRTQLTVFRGDHERHITELGAIVRRLGGEPPKKADIKGFVRKAMTKVAGLAGAEAILKAMKSNETVINDAYNLHVKKDFPQDILELVRKNLMDEQRHLAWVEDCLRNRMWESAAQSHPTP